jgi:hypothetical protein
MTRHRKLIAAAGVLAVAAGAVAGVRAVAESPASGSVRGVDRQNYTGSGPSTARESRFSLYFRRSKAKTGQERVIVGPAEGPFVALTRSAPRAGADRPAH